MRLYIKLYLAFALSAILATLALGATAFFLWQGAREREYDSYIDERARGISKFLEYSLEQDGAATDPQGAARRTAERAGAWLAAKIWIFDANGKQLGANTDAAPEFFSLERSERIGGVYFFRDFGRWSALAPLSDGGKALIAARAPRQNRSFLWLGFVVMAGLVFLFLLFPFSRLLGRPLADLRETALALAGGDLTRRTAVRHEDEIGDVARAFNSMAERIERLLRSARELNAHVSHELRSPLTRMRVALELLAQDVQSGAAGAIDRRVDALLGEIERLDALVGRLLSLARFDQTAPDAEQVDVTRLVQSIVDRLQDSGVGRRDGPVQIAAELEPGVQTIGDERWLEAAYGNLLENAVRYAPASDVIRVLLFRSGDSIIVSVDNAGSASAEELERWFEPFQRGGAASTGQGARGAGLGLAIARAALERAGGRLRAESAGGRLRFAAEIPAAPARAV